MVVQRPYTILKNKNKYTDIAGKPITNAAHLEYAKSLVIPPAYRDVKIFIYPKGKIPSIVFEGTDEAGRLQQIYSKEHREAADREKFQKLIRFGELLPEIFSNMEKDVREKDHTLDRAIALILKIVSKCYFRIGHEKYEKMYESHGISTLQRKHFYVRGDSAVEIKFVGKKGVLNECLIEDPLLVRQIIEYMKGKKPEDYVFVHGGERVRAIEINDYLKKYDPDFTSKMFRTFDTNTLLIQFLGNRDRPTKLSLKERKHLITESMQEISQCVNNTPAICKKSYANADLIELYLEDPAAYEKMFMRNTKSPREQFISFLRTLA